MSSGCYTYAFYKTRVVGWNQFNVFNKLIKSAFMKLNRRMKGIFSGTMTGRALTQTGGVGWFAMLPDAKMRSGL